MYNITIGCSNENKKVELHQYLQLLRERRIIQSKQTPYLDSVSLYVNNGRVYKIMLIAYKIAKKVGLESTHTLIKENIPQNQLISHPEAKIDDGLYIIQYVYKTRQFNRFPGESKVFL